MKKSIFGKALALLAAGAMAFTAIGCDTGDGDDSYLPETPTTYKAVDDAFTGNANVTAKWDFSSLNRNGGTDPVWGIPLANEEKTYDAKEMKQADGTDPKGATLVMNGAWVANTAALQASKKTSSLAGLSTAGGYMTLTLKEQANIVVKGKGAGAAEAARYIAITDKDDKILVSKDSLGSDKDVLFVVKGAAAGTYKIYNNGSAFYYIDCSFKSDADEMKKPAEITVLKLYYNGSEAEPTGESKYPSIEAMVDTLTFNAMNVMEENGVTRTDDLTADAIWTSSNESVAKVAKGVVSGVAEGTATIRARIGRFYAEKTVTVTPCIHGFATTLISSNLPAADTKILNWNTDTDDGASAKKVLATKGIGLVEVVDAVAKITIADPLKNIHVKETGNYALASGVYTLAADTATVPASEIWTIKDVTAGNPGLHVKDDSTSDTTNKPSWASDTGTTYKADTELYSISYKVKAAAGKSPKISGISGCINGGKGAGNIYVDLYMGDTKLGRAFCTKGTSSAATTKFETTTALPSGEVTLTFKVGVVEGKKAGQSVQIMDLAAVFE